MTANPDPSHPGLDDDGEVVRRVLAGYARNHEPAMDQIEARLARSQRAWMLEPEPVRPDRSPLPSLRVSVGLVAAAAMVLLVLAAGDAIRGRPGDTIAGPLDGAAAGPGDPSSTSGPASTTPPVSASSVPGSPDGSGSSATATSSTEASASTHVSVGGAVPAPSAGPATTHTAPAGTGGGSATSSPVSTTRAGLAGVAIDVSDLPDRLELSADGYLDWVVTGARSDGTIIRLNRGPGAITVAGPSPAAKPAAAPFAVTWLNGNPEQSRTDNRTWWSAPAQPAVFTVTVAGGLGAAELALYAGGTAPVQVTVTVEGLGSRTVELPAEETGTAGVVVVALDESSRGRDVTFVVGAGPGTGTVSLGDVTAR